MSKEYPDNAARDDVIRQLAVQSARHQIMLEGIYDTIHRINDAIERLAEAFPELRLPTLTIIPERSRSMEARERAKQPTMIYGLSSDETAELLENGWTDALHKNF